jgi:hypothetical protein
MNEPLKGDEKLLENLLNLAARVPQEVKRALFEEALIETKEAMQRTPVDTGALRASYVTHKPEINGNDISARISVGGPTAPYALQVHEDLEAYHPVGQAKYLESTLLESAPHMAERLSKRIDLNRLAKA